jgi:hypothetical protein
MKRTIRIALLAGAVFASLAFAGSALASFAPKIVVSATTSGAARIGVVVANSDDPTFRALFYIPAGYQVSTPAPGANLGSVTATAAAADLGGAILPLTGQLLAADPNTFTASQKASAAACLQGATQSQTWDLHLTAAGQTLDVPVFVMPATAQEIASGYQAKLQICLPPPDVPTSNPARATFGAKLLSATFTASAITEPATGADYRWTSLWTPYTPGVGQPNAGGSVEAQGLRHVPTAVKLTVTKKKVTVTKKIKGKKHKIVHTLVKFSSTVTDGSGAASSAVITTTAGGKKVGGASGSFSLASGKSAAVKTTAVVDSDTGSVPTGQTANPLADLYYHDLGASACTPSAIFGGVPCSDATVGGERLTATTTVKGFK